ncbi:hypothetical protein Syun_000020 [Stephania yunnanensis]|uniref:Uncharacterized protein n=1 Tax=Stephania yunnanensis TaxID=152371 RepID=A0AAP0LDY9_9MAGN
MEVLEIKVAVEEMCNDLSKSLLPEPAPKLSVIGSVALSKTGMLSSSSLDLVDGGKHDYDWLLTPPETPLFPSSDATEHQPTVAARKPSFTSRSASTTKASRLSVGQSADSSYCSRPARSSSVTRPSISSMSYNTHSSSSHRSSVLNTSSASVSSIPRPSTPAARSTATSYSRPSTPAGSRSSVSSVSSSLSSRPSTPTKPRPTPSSSFSGEKTRTLQNSRPSTPSSRPQIPANLNSSSARTNSRPSMPSHRNAASSPSTLFTSRSFSGEQVPTNGRIPAAASRGSSPSPRTRPIPQLVVLPDFPLETPPNLRTTLPERPVSAGRSRPNSGVTAKGSADAPPRRQSLSPVVTRGRLPAELSTKGRLHANGHDFGATDNQRTPPSSESASRRLTKSLSSAEGNGFGRTISKKSLDVALRHVDIRHGSANGNTRSLSGTAIFPQSIRNATSKGQQARPLETSVAVNVMEM